VTLYARPPGTNRVASIGTAPDQRVFGYDPRGNLVSESRPGGAAFQIRLEEDSRYGKFIYLPPHADSRRRKIS
jgi:hypothetical protein